MTTAHRTAILLALAAILLGCVGEEPLPANGRPEARAIGATSDSLRNRIRVSAMAFVERDDGNGNWVREVRDNLRILWEQPDSWRSVQQGAGYYEMFYEMLLHAAVEEQARAANPELFANKPRKVDLAALSKVLRERNMQVAIQTGGLRFVNGRPGACFPGMGRAYAEEELKHMRLWTGAHPGNKFDYITTDNAIYFILLTSPGYMAVKGYDNRCAFGKGTLEEAATMTVQEKLDFVATELAGYYVRMREEFPSAKLGFTEGIAAFSVTAPDGTPYRKTVESLPDLDLQQTIQLIRQRAGEAGVQLNHFDIDYSDAVEHEAVTQPSSRFIAGGRDFGRILGTERAVRSNGLRVGLFVNYFHRKFRTFDDHASWGGTDEERVVARQEAKQLSIEFLQGYVSQGGAADLYSIMFWHPFPDITGPETLEGTSMNTILEIGRAIYAYDQPLPGGLFRVGDALFSAKGSSYCDFDDWGAFVSMTGRGDTSGIRAQPFVPSTMGHAGRCTVDRVLPEGLFRVGGAVFAALPTDASRFCWFASMDSFTSITGRTSVEGVQSYGGIPSGMAHIGDCMPEHVRPSGAFVVGGSAIASVVDGEPGKYCIFDDYDRFLSWTGGANPAGLPQLPTFPPYLVFKRPCQAQDVGATPSCDALPAGFYSVAGAIFRSDGATYCLFDDWQCYLDAGGTPDVASLPATPPPACMTDAGVCGCTSGCAALPAGFYHVNGAIYRSDGATYCLFDDWQCYLDAGGNPNVASLPNDAPPACMTDSGVCDCAP